jgi:hypothetical protein
MDIVISLFGIFQNSSNSEVLVLVLFLYILPAAVVIALLIAMAMAFVRIHEARARGDKQFANSTTKRLVGALLLILTVTTASIILPVLVSG